MFRIEVTLIYAKFSKDLFIIFKVIAIGLQTKWPRFLAYPVATLKDERFDPLSTACSIYLSSYFLKVQQ